MTTSDVTAATYAISLESVQQAAQRIKGLAHRTPVLTCATLDALASDARDPTQQRPRVRLFFKCENLQKVGAFKYRGALNAVKKYQETHAVTEGETKATFVTHSSGNHAQAVALAARDANSKAVIVMPNNAPIVKQSAVRGYGAEVVLCEPTGEAREAAAQVYMDKFGGHFIHPSNDADVMSGQGTAAVELLEQVEQEFGVKLDAIVVPIGGGGLCSGVAMAAKSLSKDIKVFAAEPVGAADAHHSFQTGELSGHEVPPNTVADGLKTTLGDNNWPVIRDHVDEIVLVSDEEIVSTMKLMWERMKLVVEPSGAVAVTAVLTNKLPNSEELGGGGGGIQNIGIVISEGRALFEWTPRMSFRPNHLSFQRRGLSAAETTREAGAGAGAGASMGCDHYRRHCHVRAECCQQWVACRLCHNEQFADHEIDRHAIKEMRCDACQTVQPCARSCAHCQALMSDYFCGVCNLFDDEGASKQIFHCDGCGICRVGGRANFFHCDKCCGCYPHSLQDKHKCLEGSMHRECAICLEVTFASLESVHVLPCGHVLHGSCWEEYIRHGHYRCPSCRTRMFWSDDGDDDGGESGDNADEDGEEGDDDDSDETMEEEEEGNSGEEDTDDDDDNSHDDDDDDDDNSHDEDEGESDESSSGADDDEDVAGTMESGVAQRLVNAIFHALSSSVEGEEDDEEHHDPNDGHDVGHESSGSNNAPTL